MKKLIGSLCLMLVLTSCGTSGNTSGKYTAGEYEATSKGFGGDVTVKLTVSDTEITDVELQQTMKHQTSVVLQSIH